MRISDWSSDVCSSDLVKSAEVQRERPTVARRYATQVAGFQPWQYLLLRLQRPGPIAPELQIGTVGQLQAVSQLHVQCIHARGCGIDAAGVQVGDGAGPACRIARQIGPALDAVWKQFLELEELSLRQPGDVVGLLQPGVVQRSAEPR